MKLLKNLKENEKSIIKIYSICLVITLIAVMIGFFGGSILDVVNSILSTLSPFIIGFVIAFLLNQPYVFISNLMDKVSPNKKRKGISILLTYILAIIFIILLFSFVIPEMISSIPGIIESISLYSTELTIFLDELIVSMDLEGEIINQLNAIIDSLFAELGNILSVVINSITEMVSGIISASTNTILGIVISVYFISQKAQLRKGTKRVVVAFSNENVATKIGKVVDLSANIFNKFIVGQLSVAFILGLLCFIVMSIFQMENAAFISTVVGFSNIIPYFGPFIGAVPGVILLLSTNPIHALMFIGIVIVLQQVDNTLISPRIVGNSVGLPGLWIIFAILIAGGLFGIPGMIIGTPTFAIIYTLANNYIDKKIKAKEIISE